MSEIAVNDTLTPEKSLKQWLFNPFKFIAGTESLFLGLIIILIAATIGWLGKTHFDGVLDVHTGRAAPLWLFIAEGIIDWLCMVLFLFLSGLLISRSSWRFIDILGTQALSRWPTLLTALVMLPEANRRFGNFLLSQITQSGTAQKIIPADAFIFFTAVIISLLMIIWMVALMYKSYAISCNVKGPKAVWTFIPSLILAEAVSKVLIIVLLTNTIGANIAMSDFLPKSPQSAVPAHAFENDPEIIGVWQSVDFVSDVNEFQPGMRQFAEDLYLKNLTFNSDGTTSLADVWTKGWIFNAEGKAKAQYYIKSVDGRTYLFYPWLSGDVTIRKMQPKYYVLKKVFQ
jgi:hypothetical protein